MCVWTEIGQRWRSLECQSFEKRKLAGYFRDCIPGRNQAPGYIQAADTCKRVNLTTEQNATSETHTWTIFSDFTRRACRSHILPIEADFAEFLHMGKFVSDLIEIHGLDLNGTVG